MTTLAIVHRPLLRRASGLFAAAARFFDSVGHALDATREYGRLAAMSDAALAREGLTRDAVVAHVGRRFLRTPVR